MRAYILLDRSGSMNRNWAETIGGLNGYAGALAQTDPRTKITVAVFDSENPFEIVRECRAKDWTDIGVHEVVPRGGTPLLDAIGRLNGIVKNPKKATFTILTDGEENASNEITNSAARAIIENWQLRGYDVTYIGADFDAFAQAGALGIMQGQTMNMAGANTGATMQRVASRATLYAATGDNTAEWSDDDRVKAVQPKKGQPTATSPS